MSQDFVYTLEFLGTFYEYSHRTWGFDCFTCVYLFPDSGVIKSHTRMQLKQKKPFVCPFFGKIFTLLADFERHTKDTHRREKYFCNNNHKTFLKCWNFETHTHKNINKKIHTGYGPFDCFTCPFSFAWGNFNFLSWNTCNLTETAKISQIFICITSLLSL